ncbi:MAG: c-type cytochrome biogenesis protein CcmI [Gammaproteobacteria bacterium]|nr:MAG: c-type cytochrome biogenesis protein CcmI [Gammaproteobacteria bacterium]UCH41546.1 MAG: c-type cytochrome biogenesis protein CcmI [Gammaproteobacteria bacterium]
MSFWAIAIALLVLALVILLLPMLRQNREQVDDQRQQQNIQIAREQKRQLEAQLEAGEIDRAEFDSAYLDLQTALALELERDEDAAQKSRGRWMALVVSLAVPAASVILYLALGEYRVIGNPELASAAPTAQAASAPQMSFTEMETRIKERLRQNPEDVEGWFLLGRTYMAQQQFDEAVTAYRRSNELLPNEPGIMFALADALGMQNNGNLLGEPEELIQSGLKLAPQFPNGLWLAGMAAEQRQDNESAHRYWTQLLPLIADNPDSTREIRNLLHILEQNNPELASAAPAAPVSAGSASIRVSVDISAELRAKASAETTVFVYAKAMQGPPMPLAVRKIKLKDLPTSLELSDADAMMPALKLSSFDPVIVGARVSFSGNPVAQSGDFYTETESISSSNPPDQLSLTIDRVK